VKKKVVKIIMTDNCFDCDYIVVKTQHSGFYCNKGMKPLKNCFATLATEYPPWCPLDGAEGEER
jgi:hypothetical protein